MLVLGNLSTLDNCGPRLQRLVSFHGKPISQVAFLKVFIFINFFIVLAQMQGQECQKQCIKKNGVLDALATVMSEI